MFFVYILQSDFDNSFYIGYTTNLERRLQEHNEGKSRYTSKKIPWQLKYHENFNNKTDALKREHFLKKQRNRKFYQKLINSSAG